MYIKSQYDLRVFVEVPDFGLGPASTFLALVGQIDYAVGWEIVTGRDGGNLISRCFQRLFTMNWTLTIPSSGLNLKK